MKFLAKPETIEKIESLKGKTLFDHERGEQGHVYAITKIKSYGCDQLDEGDAVTIRVDRSIKDPRADYIYSYRGEEGLQKLLREWKEKKCQ